MLVSHRHRFIYAKTVKTASTSVESYFERFCMRDNEWHLTHGRTEYVSETGIIGYRGENQPAGTKWFNHMPADAIRNQIGEKTWNEYFKFCVIRNPFEKCISAFDYLGKEHQASRFSISNMIHRSRMTSEQLRFYDFLRRKPPLDRHIYTIKGQSCMDDVIRFESLESGIERICRRLSLPFDPSQIPNLKASSRRKKSTPAALFTQPARRLVEKLFAYELEQFDYRFPVSEESPAWALSRK